MSLIDKESDESKALRRLIIGSRQEGIDLTRDNSPFSISHNPASCSSCTEWYKEVREIGTAHRALFNRDGYVKESEFATLENRQRNRLEEIGQLMDKHLKKFHDDELLRMTREAGEKNQFRWG